MKAGPWSAMNTENLLLSALIRAVMPCASLLLLFSLAAPAAGQSEAAGTAQSSHIATFWRNGDPGERLVLTGRVLDGAGRPIAGAIVDVWQTDGDGSYHPDAYRGTIFTNDRGGYELRTAVPASYFGARHIHMRVSHGGASVDTQVLFKDDPNLAQSDMPYAILLEQSRVKGEVVFHGTFDVVIPDS